MHTLSLRTFPSPKSSLLLPTQLRVTMRPSILHLPLLFLLPLTLSKPFPATNLHPLLHSQALSHLAFHSPTFKLSLASLFGPPPSAHAIAVVGVEWGSDVFPLAAAGFSVYAFEPAAKFVAHLRETISDHPEWNVTVVPVAVGKEKEGEFELRYGNDEVSERVPRGVVDDFVKEPLAVLSVDIQGDELDVLLGSEELLGVHGVGSLWVEGIACNDKFRGVLNLLDERYVLFDFVPWGKRTDDQQDAVPRSRDSFAFNPQRPGAFDQFWDWMCREKNAHYRWLQTDILAVRRDLLTDDVYSKLAALAEDQCEVVEDPSDCRLRNLLRESEKDEL